MWVDVSETKAVRPGEFHVSRDDLRDLQKNGEQLFREDVSLKSYVSRNGKIRGVQITKISPRMAQ